MVLFQKLFKGYIFCFLGDSVGRCIFEQFARETNLKKKRSVSTYWECTCDAYAYQYFIFRLKNDNRSESCGSKIAVFIKLIVERPVLTKTKEEGI